MCPWPLDTDYFLALSLLVSRLFKVKPMQVALSHAPEGLCPSFSLVGDSVVNQVCSELEPVACRSGPMLHGGTVASTVTYGPSRLLLHPAAGSGVFLQCPSPSLEPLHAFTARGSFLGFR